MWDTKRNGHPLNLARTWWDRNKVVGANPSQPHHQLYKDRTHCVRILASWQLNGIIWFSHLQSDYVRRGRGETLRESQTFSDLRMKYKIIRSFWYVTVYWIPTWDTCNLLSHTTPLKQLSPSWSIISLSIQIYLLPILILLGLSSLDDVEWLFLLETLIHLCFRVFLLSPRPFHPMEIILSPLNSFSLFYSHSPILLSLS